jgi:hypothetical protein
MIVDLTKRDEQGEEDKQRENDIEYGTQLIA